MQIVYPALYTSADRGANNAQRWFLWTLRLEYALLFSASVASIAKESFPVSKKILVVLLIILGIMLIIKFLTRLDSRWYQARALAESVKTTTWRYAMRAHPFVDSVSIDVPRAEFRNYLKSILNTNRFVGRSLSADESADDQITKSMSAIRKLPLQDRLKFYLELRVDDQRLWYMRNARKNELKLWLYLGIGLIIYLCGIASVLTEFKGLGFLNEFYDPLIVVATALVGWVQTKKFSELSTTYKLTAHEIGIIKERQYEVRSEDQLSEFVNEAELAFSREHTQWVARREMDS